MEKKTKLTNELYDYSLGNRKLIWNKEKQAMVMTELPDTSWKAGL